MKEAFLIWEFSESDFGKKKKAKKAFVYVKTNILYFSDEEFQSISIELVYLYVLLLIYCMTKFYLYDFTSSTIKFSDLYKLVTNSKLYYRGVSNSKYGLIPSMYRNLKENKLIIDDEYIVKKYKAAKLDSKYFDIFNCNFSENLITFEEFMQHSIEYSPLIDFSKSSEITLSFATNFYGDINSYKNTNAAIYVIEDIGNSKNNHKKHKIQYYKNKININDTIFGKKLYNCTFDDFAVDYCIYNNETNDRMKYQQGLFVDIKKGVFVNGQLLTPPMTSNNDDSKLQNKLLTKFTIKSSQKIKIQKEISIKYKYEYLMDPYKYFREI